MKPKTKKALGFSIIAIAILVLFAFTAHQDGLVIALKAWSISIGITAFFVAGVFLAVSD